MSQELRNLSIDLVINQIMLGKGLEEAADSNMPEKFGFPSGLTEEEYFQLLCQKFQK